MVAGGDDTSSNASNAAAPGEDDPRLAAIVDGPSNEFGVGLPAKRVFDSGDGRPEG